MAHYGIIKADKHIITTTRQFYCSTFLSPQYVCNCSIREIGEPDNDQEKETKNNVNISLQQLIELNTLVFFLKILILS